MNAEDKQSFNKYLSCIRRLVEYPFGILRSKWQVIDKPILVSVEHADKIIKIICLLHNTIIDKKGMEHYLWDIQSIFENKNIPALGGRPNNKAKHVREAFKCFFK